jgi:hypothetical protein
MRHRRHGLRYTGGGRRSGPAGRAAASPRPYCPGTDRAAATGTWPGAAAISAWGATGPGGPWCYPTAGRCRSWYPRPCAGADAQYHAGDSAARYPWRRSQGAASVGGATPCSSGDTTTRPPRAWQFHRSRRGRRGPYRGRLNQALISRHQCRPGPTSHHRRGRTALHRGPFWTSRRSRRPARARCRRPRPGTGGTGSVSLNAPAVGRNSFPANEARSRILAEATPTSRICGWTGTASDEDRRFRPAEPYVPLSITRAPLPRRAGGAGPHGPRCRRPAPGQLETLALPRWLSIGAAARSLLHRSCGGGLTGWFRRNWPPSRMLYRGPSRPAPAAQNPPRRDSHAGYDNRQGRCRAFAKGP